MRLICWIVGHRWISTCVVIMTRGYRIARRKCKRCGKQEDV